MEPQGLSQHDHTSNASPAPQIRPTYITLDQDYARRSMSARPQQMVGPITISGSTQGRSLAMTAPTMPIQGQVGQTVASIVPAMPIPGESDHEINMIDALRNHIRDSLMGIPNNLPEIKGLQAKLPEAYDGEDDFDRLDRWLQGLLRFFKIHCLTGADKDIDWVLVTGTCLKGKAERWFSHEVERPKHRTRDWTFESVIIALYRAFITTTMAQKAMEEYLNIKYSKEEGILGFHRDLVMWAGRLAQYPDDYSFKRRIINGLPSDCLYHLTMYNKLTAEHSSMEDIVQKARHYEQTRASLKVGRNIERQPGQGSSMPTTSGQQRTVGLREPQHSRNPPARLPQGRSSASYGTQNQHPAPQPATGNRSRPAAPTPSASKGDTSKLTCYKCGKVGHIASDTKCP